MTTDKEAEPLTVPNQKSGFSFADFQLEKVAFRSFGTLLQNPLLR
jgi:hypothetical protein